MTEKDLLNDLTQIDGVLANCINPALKRAEHDAIRQVINTVGQRVELSYQLEQEIKKLKEELKAIQETSMDEQEARTEEDR